MIIDGDIACSGQKMELKLLRMDLFSRCLKSEEMGRRSSDEVVDRCCIDGQL
jgi:hypothetical protein